MAWKERAIKELRGKNLLCWCLQPEDVDGVKVTESEGCDARVLFEYVNRPEYGKEVQDQAKTKQPEAAIANDGVLGVGAAEWEASKR